MIYFMYRTCTKSTANLKMINNLIILPDTSTVYGELCWVTWLQSGSFWIEAAVDCVLSVTEWLVSNATTRFSFRTYEFTTANQSLPPLCISICQNPTHPSAKPLGSAEPSLRNNVVNYLHYCMCFYMLNDHPAFCSVGAGVLPRGYSGRGMK